MTDVHDKQTRSYNMSRIKGKNTKPEILVRKFLFSKGFRYRLHLKDLPGNPDIVLPKYKTAIFINGCFWHGHNCKSGHLPKSNLEYWEPKIGRNVERDNKNNGSLDKLGWRVLIIWECELKNEKNHILDKLLKELNHYDLA